MMESDRQGSDDKHPATAENDKIDREVNERAPKDYYYDDSTGYDSYESDDADAEEIN
jgi:hypothetical protein